ncbi:MAG: hypothetical protein HY903_23545 [Deltaproteobacteria bacterium]|nr:hypothetical protein [Deltaproteobacteria bacterium]
MPDLIIQPLGAGTCTNDDDRCQMQQGQCVDGCQSSDKTPAPTPRLVRAICFDPAKADAKLIPNPPPAPVVSPRPRDPVLIVLDNIEVGAHFEFISLTDKPDADFGTKGDVRRLDMVGYDVGNRRATIVLDPKQMADKGFQPGERLVLRQVDRKGNASDGIYVYLDPSGWANQRVMQSNDQGQQVVLSGAPLDILVGVTGPNGAPSSAATQQLLGIAVQDKDAPQVAKSNVKVLTMKWSAEDRAVADALCANVAIFKSKLGRDSFNLEEAKKLAEDQTIPEPLRNAFAKLAASDGALFKRFDYAAYGDRRDGIVGLPDYTEVKTNDKSLFLNLLRAFEPGVTFMLQNSRTGETFSGSLGAGTRDVALKLSYLEDGDPLILTYHDAAGNWGAPYAFEYAAGCKDGKGKIDPLKLQLGDYPGAAKPANP